MTDRPDAPSAPETAARLDEIAQVLADISWSVALDCLKHETFTPHGRAVLERAPDVLRAARAALLTAQEDSARDREIVRLAREWERALTRYQRLTSTDEGPGVALAAEGTAFSALLAALRAPLAPETQETKE